METITDNKEEATTFSEYEGNAADDQMKESSRENPYGDFLNAENKRFSVSRSSHTSDESIAPTDVQAAPRPQNQLAEYFVPENKEAVNEHSDFRPTPVERKSCDTEFELKTQKQGSEKSCVSRNEQSCETLPEQQPNTGTTVVGIDANQNLFNPRHPDITRQEQTRVTDMVARAVDRFLGFLMVPLILVFGIVFYLVDVDSDTTPAVDHFQKDVTEQRDSEDDFTPGGSTSHATVAVDYLADYVHDNRFEAVKEPVELDQMAAMLDACYIHEKTFEPVEQIREDACYIHEKTFEPVERKEASCIHEKTFEPVEQMGAMRDASYFHEETFEPVDVYEQMRAMLDRPTCYIHEETFEPVERNEASYIHGKTFERKRNEEGHIYLEAVDTCYIRNVVEERTSDFDEDCEESIKRFVVRDRPHSQSEMVDDEEGDEDGVSLIPQSKLDEYITPENKNDTSENGNLLNGVTGNGSHENLNWNLRHKSKKSDEASFSRDGQSHEPPPKQHRVKDFIGKAVDRFFGVLDIPVTIGFGIVLYLVDVGSDIMAAVNHFKEGNPVWGSLTITFVVLPSLCWAAASWTLWHVHDPPDNQQGRRRRRIRMVLAVLLLDPLVR